MKETTKWLLEVFRLRKCFEPQPETRLYIAESIRWHRNSGFKRWIRNAELMSSNFRHYKMDELEG